MPSSCTRGWYLRIPRVHFRMCCGTLVICSQCSVQTLKLLQQPSVTRVMRVVSVSFVTTSPEADAGAGTLLNSLSKNVQPASTTTTWRQAHHPYFVCGWTTHNHYDIKRLSICLTCIQRSPMEIYCNWHVVHHNHPQPSSRWMAWSKKNLICKLLNLIVNFLNQQGNKSKPLQNYSHQKFNMYIYIYIYILHDAPGWSFYSRHLQYSLQRGGW